MTTELRKSINSTLNKLGFISPKRGNFLEGSGIFEGIRVYFNTHSLTIRNKDTRTKILYPNESRPLAKPTIPLASKTFKSAIACC